MSDDTAMVAWLRATIEGDKRAAEDAGKKRGGAEWRASLDPEDMTSVTGADRGVLSVIVEPDEHVMTVHIARHDPANVIADCDAKLAIIEECLHTVDRRTLSGDLSRSVLCLLAYAYRHRPGWKEGWRP